MLFGMPDAFMRAKAKEALGKELPPQGEYAVGNVFFPPENPDVLKDCKSILERLTKQRGLEVLGWRPVPVDNSMLGQDPLDSEPDTEQVSWATYIILQNLSFTLDTNKYMHRMMGSNNTSTWTASTISTALHCQQWFQKAFTAWLWTWTLPCT